MLCELPCDLFARLANELKLNTASKVRVFEDRMQRTIRITNLSLGLSIIVDEMEIYGGRQKIGPHNITANSAYLVSLERSSRSAFEEKYFVAEFPERFAIKPSIQGDWAIPAKTAQENMILVIASTVEEATQFAKDIMGWKGHEWVFVDNYNKMLSYRNSSVYICGEGRERKDFGAIEGLFLIGGHSVMDMNE